MIVISHSERISEAFKKILELDPNLESIFSKYDEIILKPNFVMPRKYAVTNIELLKTICGFGENFGIKIKITETPGMEFEYSVVEKYLELKKLEKSFNNVYINLNPKNFKKIKINGDYLDYIYIIEDFLETPWINIFKIKTHVITKVSLSVKNIMGILGHDTRREMHIKGVNKCLIDVAQNIKPAYNLGESFPAMDANGPTFGRIRWLNIIVGGNDSIELDNFITKSIMKLKSDEIAYLNLCSHYPVVRGDVDVIRKITPFIEPNVSKVYVNMYNLMYVIDKIFYPIFGKHFNAWLYSLKFFGTKPEVISEENLIIDEEICKICKFGAISFNNNRVSIDYKKCISCMDCVDKYPNIFKIETTFDRLKSKFKFL